MQNNDLELPDFLRRSSGPTAAEVVRRHRERQARLSWPDVDAIMRRVRREQALARERGEEAVAARREQDRLLREVRRCLQ